MVTGGLGVSDVGAAGFTGASCGEAGASAVAAGVGLCAATIEPLRIMDAVKIVDRTTSKSSRERIISSLS